MFAVVVGGGVRCVLCTYMGTATISDVDTVSRNCCWTSILHMLSRIQGGSWECMFHRCRFCLDVHALKKLLCILLLVYEHL